MRERERRRERESERERDHDGYMVGITVLGTGDKVLN